MSDLALFISHSSVDLTVAKTLVELFEKALKLPARQIRCTSVDGYRLPVGADTDEQLRREIFVAKAFVGIVTPSSARSTYVLFELGARWGAKRHLAPVLARGADSSVLGGPLSGLNALDMAERNQVLQLVEDIAEYLEVHMEPISSFQAAADLVVAAAKTAVAESAAQPESRDASDEEIKVLQFLASQSEEVTAEQVASALRVTEQKAKYYLHELERLSMVSWNVFPGVPTVYYLKQDGRAALVKHGLL
jgi:hypothetical protein